MKQAKGKIVLCAMAALAVAGIGVLRVSSVHAAQRDLVHAARSYYSDTQSIMFSLLTSGRSDRGPVSHALPDQTDVLSKQNAVGIAGSAGALAAGFVALVASAVVGWVFGSVSSVVIMGLWAWAVNAAAVAAISHRGVLLALELPPFSGVAEPTLPPNTLTAFFMAGLLSTFAWQTVVPVALGGLAGLKARAWRLSLVEYEQYRDDPPVWTPPTAVPTSRRCACGALNRLTQETCYACGARLTGHSAMTMSEG